MTEATNPQAVQQTIAERKAAEREQITQETTQLYSGCAADNRVTQLKDDIARKQATIREMVASLDAEEFRLSVMQTLLYQATSPIVIGMRAFYSHKPVVVTGVSVRSNGDVLYKYKQVLKGDRISSIERVVPWHSSHEMLTPAAEQALQERRKKRDEERRLAKAAAALP